MKTQNKTIASRIRRNELEKQIIIATDNCFLKDTELTNIEIIDVLLKVISHLSNSELQNELKLKL